MVGTTSGRSIKGPQSLRKVSNIEPKRYQRSDMLAIISEYQRSRDHHLMALTSSPQRSAVIDFGDDMRIIDVYSKSRGLCSNYRH